MKIVKGFISNSSTSSFICDICGHQESGWDYSLLDCEMIKCINEHTFCQEHLPEIFYEENVDENGECSEESCPICQFQEIGCRDVYRYFVKKYNFSPEEAFEEIKKINKRRRKLYDTEFVEYGLKKLGITSGEFLRDLKDTFKTYSEFMKYLRVN